MSTTILTQGTGVLYTGIGSGGGGMGGGAIAGTTRFNNTNNKFEMFDGYQWLEVTQGYPQPLTLEQMVETAEDGIAATIENEYADNVTIQDALKEWEEANKRFRVVLALAENK